MANSYIRLTGLGPKLQGLCWESDHLLRIGRLNTAEVVLADASVEQMHAEVKYQGQRWIARPLTPHSLYPTLLNEVPLPARGAPLRVNDILRLGNLALQVAALGTTALDDGLGVLPMTQDQTRVLRPATAGPPAVPSMPTALAVPPVGPAALLAAAPAHRPPPPAV